MGIRDIEWLSLCSSMTGSVDLVRMLGDVRVATIFLLRARVEGRSTGESFFGATQTSIRSRSRLSRVTPAGRDLVAWIWDLIALIRTAKVLKEQNGNDSGSEEAVGADDGAAKGIEITYLFADSGKSC